MTIAWISMDWHPLGPGQGQRLGPGQGQRPHIDIPSGGSGTTAITSTVAPTDVGEVSHRLRETLGSRSDEEAADPTACAKLLDEVIRARSERGGGRDRLPSRHDSLCSVSCAGAQRIRAVTASAGPFWPLPERQVRAEPFGA
jgi:hypothetical protein